MAVISGSPELGRKRNSHHQLVMPESTEEQNKGQAFLEE
jgi:hypothetical protein